MNKVQTSTESVCLDTGQSVPRSEYHEIMAAADVFIPTMLPNHSYLAETMVGQEIWHTHSERRIGSIIAHAVRRGRLPLLFADSGKRATKLYELDD